ncbi:MAG: hypothetical protein GC184_15215 [Rhizobiales bacterium]|nr:hypothetical protein [Hyphomicrobiales bacterium]
MKHLKTLLPALFLLALAACVSPEEQAAAAAAQRQADEAECSLLGFQPKTEAFANCMLKLQEIRATEDNTDQLRRANTPSPFWPYGRPGYGPYW